MKIMKQSVSTSMTFVFDNEETVKSLRMLSLRHEGIVFSSHKLSSGEVMGILNYPAKYEGQIKEVVDMSKAISISNIFILQDDSGTEFFIDRCIMSIKNSITSYAGEFLYESSVGAGKRLVGVLFTSNVKMTAWESAMGNEF